MNERIIKLAHESGLYTKCLVHSAVPFDQLLEQFAELIVRECAEVASDYDGAHYVGTEIEKHFGIK